MLILAVDTSTREGSLAVLRDRELLGEIASSGDEPYSSRLFRGVDELLGPLHLKLEQVDVFAVAAGPGSFTGLRVGLTAVKAWAEIYGRPIAAVSGLEAVAAQSAALAGAPARILLAPTIDARRGQVFGGLYESALARFGEHQEPLLKLLGDEVVLDAGEFLAMVEELAGGVEPVIVTSAPEVIEPALAQSSLRGARVERVSGMLAPVIARLGRQRAERGQLVDALHLDANYVRRSDAELRWKGF